MFVTAKQVPFRPKQCESCDNFDSGAERGGANRCAAPAFATVAAFRPLLACFSGQSQEPCPEFHGKKVLPPAGIDIYLCRPGGQKEGPFKLHEINRDIAAKKFTDEEFWAHYEGLKDWIPLYQIKGKPPTLASETACKPTCPPRLPQSPLSSQASDSTPRQEGSLLDMFWVISMSASVVVGGLGLLLAGRRGAAVGGMLQFGFFLAAAVFATTCAFAPRRTLTNPKIAATIGISNPAVARAACIVGALVLWTLTLAPIFSK